MNRLFDSLFERPPLMRIVALVVALAIWFGNLPNHDMIDTVQKPVSVTVSSVAPGMRAFPAPRQVRVVFAVASSVRKQALAGHFTAEVSAGGTGPGVIVRSISVRLPGATQLLKVDPAQVRVHIVRVGRRLPA